MEKLFDEFDAVNLEDWLAKITKDLKGKPIESLDSNPEMDIQIKAYHHKENASPMRQTYTRKNNDWKIRKAYTSEPNKRLLADLNEGITAVGLLHTPLLKEQTASVLFEHINSDISLVDPLTDYSVFHESAILNFDILGRSVLSGKWIHSLDTFVDFYSATKQQQNIWVSGSLYGDTGATSIQELAICASHLNEYIQCLVDKGENLERINQNICIELSVTDNFFVNISKMRAIRGIVKGIFEAYDSDHKHHEITLYAKTSCRFLAENDANNNLLRETTQAMSAVLGGCDVLTVQSLISNDAGTNELNRRMAKNIQLVLKEESYLDKVVDPGQGSYFIESLTNQLLEKGWEQFKLIENKGGFLSAIESEHIQKIIAENKAHLTEQLNTNEKTFLGVNKFHSSLEDWNDPKPILASNKGDFEALTPFRLESFYKQTTEA